MKVGRARTVDAIESHRRNLVFNGLSDGYPVQRITKYGCDVFIGLNAGGVQRH